jgi:hypothetical protein
MDKRDIQGSCVLCDYQFSIPISELQDGMTYPFCGIEADIEVKCPRCGGKISAKNPDLERYSPDMETKGEYIWDRAKTSGEGQMVVLKKGKIAAYDVVTLLFLMLIILFMLIQ